MEFNERLRMRIKPVRNVMTQFCGTRQCNSVTAKNVRLKATFLEPMSVLISCAHILTSQFLHQPRFQGCWVGDKVTRLRKVVLHLTLLQIFLQRLAFVLR